MRKPAQGPVDSAERILLAINAQCKNVRQLMYSEASRVAQNISSACHNGHREGKALELMSGRISTGELPKALGIILSRLLPALHISHTCDAKFYECTICISSALERLLALHTCHPSSVPVPLQLSLAKQLQQADVLQPLCAAMELLTAFATEEVAQAAGVAGSAVVRTSNLIGGFLKSLVVVDTPVNTSPVLARQLAVQLLLVAVHMCYLWPGGVHKSATARPLLPAVAKLAAVTAQSSTVLYRQQPGGLDAQNAMIAAMTAACLLINQPTAVREAASMTAEFDRSEGPRSCETRLLLKLVLAALADVLLRCTEDKQQQGFHAVQQLWVAFGYERGQLTKAANVLQTLRTTVDACADGKTSPASSSMQRLVYALGDSWDQLDQDESVSATGATCNMPLWQQLHEESSQLVLLMRVVEYLFLHGPEGGHQDIDLLSATVSSYCSYFTAASPLYLNSPKQGVELPSAVFLVHDVVPLLLQFLQYGKEAAQQARQQTSRDSNISSSSGSTSAADQYTKLQAAVLAVLVKLCCFTQSVSKRGDTSLQDTWLVWGQHVTQLIEELMRKTVPAAAYDTRAVLLLQQQIVPSADAWLQQITSDLSPCATDALQLYSKDELVVSIKQDSADAKDFQACCRDRSSNHNNRRYAAHAASTDNSTATAAAAPAANTPSRDSQFKPVRLSQAGSSHSGLQLLSLMTSYCKGLMQTVELVCGVHVLLMPRQACAVSVLSTAAACSRTYTNHEWTSSQSLLQPAVRPWLSLLGRCLVMMGQRLKVLQSVSDVQQHSAEYDSFHTIMQLHRQQDQLKAMNLQQLDAMDQLISAEQAIKDCSADIEELRSRLATLKPQKGKQQLFKLLQLELQTRESSLHKAQSEREATVSLMRTLETQQEEVVQEVNRTNAELKLFAGSIRQSETQVLADLSSSIDALLEVAKMLTDCWIHNAHWQQQQHAAKSSDRHSAAAAENLVAVLQRVLMELLPILLVIASVCHQLLDRDAGDTLLDAGDDSSAAEQLAKRLVGTVSAGSFMRRLQALPVGKVVQKAVQAAATSTAHIMSAHEGDSCLSALLSSKPCQQLHEQLVAIGSELITALPHCWCCNNPGCGNLSADSELQLISGSNREQVCAGCTGGSRDKEVKLTAARYCSVECQKQHWQQHKHVCRGLHKQRKLRNQQH